MPAEADPDMALDLARATAEVYAQATADMLDKVSRRLAAGIDEAGWAETKLIDVVRLRNEANAVLADLERSSIAEATNAINQANQIGATRASAELGQGSFARANPRAVDALLKETLAGLNATRPFILRTVLDSYRSIIAQATVGSTVGLQTRRQATARSLDAFAKQGITGFRDSAGRQWDMQSYAEMAVRTASGRASIDGSLDRFTSSGHDLVIVSDAPEECSICRPWEGRILSISGDSRGKQDGGVSVAGSVSEARAAGLQHANCRHSMSLYVAGLTTVPKQTSDPQGDKLRQQQRYLERNVRAVKRRVASQAAFNDGLKASRDGVDMDNAAKLKKLRDQQNAANDRLKQFIADNDRKSLPYRTSLTAR